MRIGLALGGGGVRGLAHIPVLEALDAHGLKPAILSGASMGAIIGALYASGLSGAEIRELVTRHLILKSDNLRSVLRKRAHLLRWTGFFAPEFGRGGLMRSERFISYLLTQIRKDTFEALEIPLIVVASDYWAAEEVLFESGPLLPALQASMAVPGVFSPVKLGERVLVDGGLVNSVPYDHLLGRADVTIAVDVTGTREPGRRRLPSVADSILGTFEIMEKFALAEKIRRQPPDIVIRPEIRNVRLLDFSKAEQVLEAVKPAVAELSTRLEALTAGGRPARAAIGSP